MAGTVAGNAPRSTRDLNAPASAPLARFGVRFAALYLGLFVLATQISGSMLPNLRFDYNGLGRLWPMREVTLWLARQAFGITSDLDFASNGEPLFFWVQTVWILIVAAIAAAVWAALDRSRDGRVLQHPWVRLFFRLALAAQLIEYGMTKVIPTQFPAPSLATLVTPVGDLSLSALLWASIGASPAYQIFTGCVEVLGGVLLLLPRTATLGAIVSLGALLQVFVLNMTFDIGLKLVSFHLILLALVMLAPDVPRLLDVFLRHRSASSSERTPLMKTWKGERIVRGAQIVFGVYLLAMYAYMNVTFWQVAGGGAPRSALYGIWNVETLSVDGEIRPASANDYDRRWRRLILDEPGAAVFQRTDDSFARYRAALDPVGGTLTLTKAGSRRWQASFSIVRPSADRLIVDGEMDGRRIRMDLARVDFETLRLLNSTFRWVRPHDP